MTIISDENSFHTRNDGAEVEWLLGYRSVACLHIIRMRKGAAVAHIYVIGMSLWSNFRRQLIVTEQNRE